MTGAGGFWRRSPPSSVFGYVPVVACLFEALPLSVLSFEASEAPFVLTLSPSKPRPSKPSKPSSLYPALRSLLKSPSSAPAISQSPTARTLILLPTRLAAIVAAKATLHGIVVRVAFDRLKKPLTEVRQHPPTLCLSQNLLRSLSPPSGVLHTTWMIMMRRPSVRFVWCQSVMFVSIAALMMEVMR